MIDEALLHFPRIGRVRLARLHAIGIRSWQDVIDRAHELPSGIRCGLVDESRRCLAALQAHDIGYFVGRLASKDRWRVLASFLDDVSFFDVETTGLDHEDSITVIACWHRGEIHTFVEHENLDDFLDLLDDVQLLSSFNGSTFDVPRVLDTFHIPGLPCPHLDLRWLCYHQQLRGGLKEISHQLQIARPLDLRNVTGQHAAELWARWEHFRDSRAREQLIRYCAADVLLLVALAEKLVGRAARELDPLWAQLPLVSEYPDLDPPAAPVSGGGDAFGAGSPSRLRAWRSRAG